MFQYIYRCFLRDSPSGCSVYACLSHVFPSPCLSLTCPQSDPLSPHHLSYCALVLKISPILGSHPSISTSLRRKRRITTPFTKELTIVQRTEHHLRQTPTEMPAWPETVISNLNNVQIMIAMDVTIEGDRAMTLIKDRSTMETQAVGKPNAFTQLRLPIPAGVKKRIRGLMGDTKGLKVTLTLLK